MGSKADAELLRLKAEIYDLNQTINRLKKENTRVHSKVYEYGTKLQKINKFLAE